MTTKTAGQRIAGGGEEAIRVLLEELRARGVETTAEQAEQIGARMREMTGYQPKVGFFGKTGVGKSSLCNALFGHDVAPVSDVAACTRDANEYLLRLGAGTGGIILVDVPGVGEGLDRDHSYSALYRRLIPKLDVLVWVVKADDRAFAIEQRFYRDVVKPTLGAVPLIVAINQADKIEPVRNWNAERRVPGPAQEPNLTLKHEAVREVFSGVAAERVVVVSAVERYRLGELLEVVVEAVPRSKRLGVVREASETARTEKAVASAESGFWEETWETVKRVVRDAARIAVAEGIPIVLRAAATALRRWLRF